LDASTTIPPADTVGALDELLLLLLLLPLPVVEALPDDPVPVAPVLAGLPVPLQDTSPRHIAVRPGRRYR
jgi:hypothetical protein